MVYRIHYLFLLVGFLATPDQANAQSKHQKIKSALMSLSAVTGSWQVESKFTPRKGDPVIEQGQYIISWALDSTYLQWTGSLVNQATGKSRQFQCWITYDTKQHHYKQIYFYTRTDNQVVLKGTFNAVENKYITETTLHLSDGVTEVLRNELILKDGTHIQKSFARFDDAPEVQNFTATWVRLDTP